VTTLTTITTPFLSNWNHIDALLDSGPGWNWLTPKRNTIFYSFAVNAETSAPTSGVSGNLEIFSITQQNAVRDIFRYVSQITGIAFSETIEANIADLHFANANIDNPNFAGLTDWNYNYRYDKNKLLTSYDVQAYLYIDTAEYGNQYLSPQLGNFSYELLLHEIGHVLGLKHPFSGNIALPTEDNNTEHSLMSYTKIGVHSQYSPYDIAALKWLYGDDGLGGALGVGSQGKYLMTTADNDILIGTSGNDVLDGVEGIDTALYNGTRNSYTLKKTGDAYEIQGSQGIDNLLNIEYIKFADMRINLQIQALAKSIDPKALQGIEELYAAFFNRVPDADGLSYWITQFKNGSSIRQIAESFYDAGVEHSAVTGYSANMSNQDFVNRIYTNVLGRTEGADAEGLAYWSTALSSGNESRGSLVTSILNSAHTFKSDPTWSWVADLLDNKIKVANIFAVDAGLNYNSPEQSITQGMAIAKAVSPTDINAAIALIGLAPDQLSLL
jgi:hypothetical protein